MAPIPRKEAEGRTRWPHRSVNSNILDKTSDVNPQFLKFVQILPLGWNDTRYMSGFLKMVLCLYNHPDTFPRKNTGFFLQSTTDRLSTNSLLNHLACVWLAGFPPLSLQGMSSQGCPAKKISTPPPQGIIPGTNPPLATTW